MQELNTNIFSDAVLEDASAICFTSNGIVKKDGTLVMGAGIARQFARMFPWLPKEVGNRVKVYGNQVHIFESQHQFNIVSFPTKYSFADPSDLNLIHVSTGQLVDWSNRLGWTKVYLSRPGCGLGGLSWKLQVKPLIQPLLDDRFIILTNNEVG